MYYIWRLEALTRLKENLRKKWVDDLPNLNLFIERVEKRDRTINPCYFVNDSESYFERLFYGKLKKKIFQYRQDILFDKEDIRKFTVTH